MGPTCGPIGTYQHLSEVLFPDFAQWHADVPDRQTVFKAALLPPSLLGLRMLLRNIFCEGGLRVSLGRSQPNLLTKCSKNLVFDLFLGAGVVSIGFALKFRYGRSNFHDIGKITFSQFRARELLDTSSLISRPAGTT